jgi:uncharacterized membrane protein
MVEGVKELTKNSNLSWGAVIGLLAITFFGTSWFYKRSVKPIGRFANGM